MNVFYNLEGIGDTLIITLHDIEPAKRAVEKKGDVARIFDSENGETTGYNIFNISTYGAINERGPLELKQELQAIIERALQENDFSHELSFEGHTPFVVGFVEHKEKHPNADKLSICKVNVGEETLQIVCGAPNVEAGQTVVVAKVGAVMPSGLLIKKSCYGE